MTTVYEAAGGDEGLLRLAAAWHERVLTDDVVAHASSHGYHPDHTRRPAAYWAEALGGPSFHSAGCGDETSVVHMHNGNGAHEEMDRRAIDCFDAALLAAGLPTEDGLHRSCTTTSPGPPPRRWPPTTTTPTTSPPGSPSRRGPGTAR